MGAATPDDLATMLDLALDLKLVRLARTYLDDLGLDESFARADVRTRIALLSGDLDEAL